MVQAKPFAEMKVGKKKKGARGRWYPYRGIRGIKLFYGQARKKKILV